MSVSFIDKDADRVYIIYAKKNKLGVMQHRPHYVSDKGIPRVVPGTHWWRYVQDAEDELRALARINGWKKH